MKFVVKIPFYLDPENDSQTFIYAITNILLYDTIKSEKITKKDIINEIKVKVFDIGMSVINFPEYWGFPYNEKENEIYNIAEELWNKKFKNKFK
jgi:arginine/lysine/ornithine decarboxylase